MNQKTISHSIRAAGIGLHSGKKTHIKLKPAEANTGIRFVRTDLNTEQVIPAISQNVTDTRLSTTIGNGVATVSTIEHLMAAICGLGIDNLIIEIDGQEVPIMDGSAAPFVFLLQSAGITMQPEAKVYIKINKAIAVADGGATAVLKPHDGFRISFKIDFDHPMLDDDNSDIVFDLNDASMVREIGRARTFGFVSDYDMLVEAGLAKGGSLENAIIFTEDGVANEDGLRYANECVRHKALDSLGDLYLAGAQIIGEYDAYKAGHALNTKMVQALMASKDSWEFVSSKEIA
jgi:UDP-3-O-[3-hydroxymyristoyl] N-acetylglucosamine deacetylase